MHLSLWLLAHFSIPDDDDDSELNDITSTRFLFLFSACLLCATDRVTGSPRK